MIDKSLFYATVAAVYPNTVYEIAGAKKTIKSNAYSVDVVPTNKFRGALINVPVLRSTAGGTNGSGITTMPDEGDLVVCSYIEGHINFPICLGSVTNIYKQTMSSEGNQRNDFTFHHVSGNIIQMRNSNINIKHKSGAEILIDSSGNITIKSGKEITVKSGKEVSIDSPKIKLGKSAVEKILKGTSFKEYWDSTVSIHTHPTIFGPTGPSDGLATPLNESLLSTVSTTE